MCGAHSVHVARVAEEVGVQREALRAGLIGELLAALLTVVALKVVVFVHRHDPEDVFTALKEQTEISRATFPVLSCLFSVTLLCKVWKTAQNKVNYEHILS